MEGIIIVGICCFVLGLLFGTMIMALCSSKKFDIDDMIYENKHSQENGDTDENNNNISES